MSFKENLKAKIKLDRLLQKLVSIFIGRYLEREFSASLFSAKELILAGEEGAVD